MHIASHISKRVKSLIFQKGSASQTLVDFLKTPVPIADPAETRPRKRQKIERPREPPSHVTIARVTLDLQFEEKSALRFPSKNQVHAPVVWQISHGDGDNDDEDDDDEDSARDEREGNMRRRTKGSKVLKIWERDPRPTTRTFPLTGRAPREVVIDSSFTSGDARLDDLAWRLDKSRPRSIYAPIYTRTRDDDGYVWMETKLRLEKRGPKDHLIVTHEVKCNLMASVQPLDRQSAITREKLRLWLESPTVALSLTQNPTWSPNDFYQSVHQPASADDAASAISVERLATSLYPFQKRSLAWLLAREGVQWSVEEQRVVPLEDDSAERLPYDFVRRQDADGEAFYYSDIFAAVNKSVDAFGPTEFGRRGGIVSVDLLSLNTWSAV